MKTSYLAFCLMLFTCGMAHAQQIEPKDPETIASSLQALYGLDDAQTAQVLVIQKRRAKNLSEVAPLKSSRPAEYLRKRQAIANGTTAAIKKILRAEQMAVFKKHQEELELKRSAKIAEMKENGVSKEQIKLAIIEIE